MTRRPLPLAAVIAGIALGAITAAIASGDHRSQRAATTDTPAPERVRVGPPRRPDDRLPDGRYSGEYPHFIVDRASIELASRVRGVPGWAIRTFTGERRTIRHDQRTLAHPLYRQRMRCAELVRTYRGQAGWVFAGRVFRATTPGAPGPLDECGSRARPKPIARFATVLTFPDPATPLVERTVVYGLAPPGTTAVRLGERRIALARSGGFLGLLGPGERDDRLTLELTGRDGRTTRVPLAHRDEEPRFPPGFKGPKLLTPIAGSVRAEARAPDPAGGPGWAVPVENTKEGPLCVGQPGQVAGERIGAIDTTYGLFTATAIPRLECIVDARRLTDERPCAVGWGGGGVDDPLREDTTARRAKIERRVGGGRFTVTATCREDVDRVTIRTPRDLRTLVPSTRGHVVFALYDGDFPSGEIVVGAHLRDGTTRSQRFTPSL